MRSTAVVVSVAVLALPGVAAQEAASPSTGQPRIEFEVASVRPNTNPTSMGLNQPPGRFMASGLPLQLILTLALRDPSQPQVQPQIEGMPGWASTERFDISAKMPDGAPPEQMPAMLRSLLDDRFALRTHLETREEAIYELVVAREDGRLGRQMTRTTVDCGPIRERRAAAVKEAMGAVGGAGLFGFAGAPSVAGGPVLDDAPTIGAAVKDQLGLELRNARGPVEYIVVDHIERPEPD